MKFSIAITTLASAMSISASPLSFLRKREFGGVLLCTGANSTGTCSYDVYELDKCHQLKAPFYQNTSTFSPDGEEFYCYPHYNYENKNNLTAIKWNTIISSFDCTRR
ncbi:hypothetical protein FPOAC1_010408 [Fusarium poae]|uniref:hypothetical protein n=1 Tax=Fusarium poae TaxID=36050 RepID=UPI001CEB0C90|nr:hypothetical protein FPOAC1_010408 [Fusarium poae]KAG8665609.1 hypothetical protein FPOAC1_010408 [Fusarium poae]